MRAVIVVGVLVACGSRDKAPVTEGSATVAQIPIQRLDLPRMDESARVTVLSRSRPAALVWVDARGHLAVGKTGARWGGDITPPASRLDGDLYPTVLQAVVDGKGAAADDARIILADYRKQTDAIRARLAAIRQAQRSWPSGSRRDGPLPGRLSTVDAVELVKLGKLAPLVIATPSAPAPAVVEVLRVTGGALAVDHLGQLAALEVAFSRERDIERTGTDSWIEVSIDTKGVHLMLLPEERESVVPWAGAAIDRTALASALQRIKDKASLRVDIVVREDTIMQTFVELLAALAATDLRNVAVAAGPTAEDRREMLRRVRRNAADIVPGALTSVGDLDKPQIREVVRAQMRQMQYCYDKRLLVEPRLQGTLMLQFFIGPEGKVTSASASGVDPVLAECITKAVERLEFPKPKGGGVQVNYPFTFRTF